MKNVMLQPKNLLIHFTHEKHDNQLIFLFSLAIFCVCLINLTSWRYAYYSDEWDFFMMAQQLAKGVYAPNIFDLNGVFGTNPILGSYYQALFLKIFGSSVLSWKLSSVVLVIPILVTFFYWVRSLVDRKVAWLATCLFGTSHLLINFIKISYPNHLAFLLFIILLWHSQSIKTNPTYFKFGMLGLVFGLSYYIFIGPLFPIMLIPAVVPLFIPDTWKHLGIPFRRLIVSSLTYSIVVLPSLLVTDSSHWQAMKTLFNRGASTSSVEVIHNVLGKFYLFLLEFEPIHIHFSGGRIVNPMVALFILVGLAVAITQMKKFHTSSRLIFLYIAVCVTIGISDRNEVVGITRSFFLLPFLMVFAAIGVDRINKWLKQFGTVLAIVAAFLSFYFIYITYPMQAQQHVFSQILRESSKGKITYVYPYNVDARISILEQLVDAYGYPQTVESISNAAFDPCRLNPERTIIFLSGDIYTQEKIKQSACKTAQSPIRLEHYYYN